MIRKLVPADAVQTDERRRRIRLRISMTAVDRDGEVLLAEGAKLDAFRTNPMVLFSHDPEKPVGNGVDVQVVGEELHATVQFFEPDEDVSGVAEQLFRLYSRGKMKAASVGFIPIRVTEDVVVEGQTGRAFLEWELLEFSLVAIPSLREALVLDERGLALAHAKALGARWRPSVLSLPPEVAREFRKTLAAMQDSLNQVRHSREREQIDAVCTLLEVAALQAAMLPEDRGEAEGGG